LKAGTTIYFSIYWLKEKRWEGTDYSVEIIKSAA
jgi:hypothetical protein